MNFKLFFACALSVVALGFTSCSDDDDEKPGTEVPETPDVPEAQPDGPQKMILQGKVADGTPEGVYANMVYVDFSKNVQTGVARKSWYLGFYCGEDFHVTLNQSLARAASTGKTDFAAVSLKDAEAAPELSAGMMDFPSDVTISDNATRDLDKTIFGEIASDEAQSNVFLVATTDLKDRNSWFKVKVSRQENGYKVAYGRVNDTTPTVIVVKKESEKTFVGFSLETGAVVELPQQWDLMWSNAIALNKMPNGREILGPASDVIATNSYNNVETAVVMVEEVGKYADFTKEGLSKVKFQKEANVIGTAWRTAPMPNATPGPKADRFYVIKDTEGNYYKLRFLHFCEEDGGERGCPELEFELLK